MIVSLSDLINFPTFYNQVKKEKLSINVAYKLLKLKREIDLHLEFYYENLKKIIFNYSQKNEKGEPQFSQNGENILIIPELVGECSEKMKELMDFKVELTDYNFQLSDFDNITLEVELLETFFPFIEQKRDCQ